MSAGPDIKSQTTTEKYEQSASYERGILIKYGLRLCSENKQSGLHGLHHVADRGGQ